MFLLGTILGNSMYVHTPRGVVPKRLLRPTIQMNSSSVDLEEDDNHSSSDIVLTDRGSRIGVMLVPTEADKTKGAMHFIINGIDQGPCTTEIPLGRAPLHVVIDVYGSTKRIRIIQLYGSKQP